MRGTEDRDGRHRLTPVALGRVVVGDVWWCRGYIAVAAGLFALGLVLALVAYVPMPEAGASGGTQTRDGVGGGTFAIAVNNLLVAVTLCSGWVLLGMPTVSGLLYNGYLLGRIVEDIVSLGYSPLTVVVYIIPHGLLEVPGLLLASAVGLVVPLRFAEYVLDRRDGILDRSEMVSLVRVVALAFVLVGVGAVVEARVTVPLANALTS